MKKILAIILAVLLTFGVTVTAFATNKVTLPSKADAAEYDKTYSSSSKKQNGTLLTLLPQVFFAQRKAAKSTTAAR